MIIKIEIQPRGKEEFGFYHLSQEREDNLRISFEKTDFYFHHNGFNDRDSFGNYLDKGKQARWAGYMMAELETFK